jgi:hypothetical protein
MFTIKPPAAWELKLLTAAQLLQPILARPSLEGPSLRLALRGEEITRIARDTAIRGQMDIERASRRLKA